jgi:hypothetical protein
MDIGEERQKMNKTLLPLKTPGIRHVTKTAGSGIKCHKNGR